MSQAVRRRLPSPLVRGPGARSWRIQNLTILREKLKRKRKTAVCQEVGYSSHSCTDSSQENVCAKKVLHRRNLPRVPGRGADHCHAPPKRLWADDCGGANHKPSLENSAPGNRQNLIPTVKPPSEPIAILPIEGKVPVHVTERCKPQVEKAPMILRFRISMGLKSLPKRTVSS